MRIVRAGTIAVVLLAPASGQPGRAATIAPPMLDITHQCEAGGKRNATAMSECVVAESEARSEVLQRWATYSDASAEKCVKLGRKAKRFPYSVIAKCLSTDVAVAPSTLDPHDAAARPEKGGGVIPSLSCAASYFFSSSKCEKGGS